MRMSKLVILAAVMAITTLTGCESARSFKTGSATRQATIRIVVDQAIVRFIDHKPTALEREQRAADVGRIAGELKAYVTGDAVTISALDAEIRKHLPSTMSRADRMLIEDAIATVIAGLTRQVSDGQLRPEDKVLLSRLFDWVIIAAGGEPPTIITGRAD